MCPLHAGPDQVAHEPQAGRQSGLGGRAYLEHGGVESFSVKLGGAGTRASFTYQARATPSDVTMACSQVRIAILLRRASPHQTSCCSASSAELHTCLKTLPSRTRSVLSRVLHLPCASRQSSGCVGLTSRPRLTAATGTAARLSRASGTVRNASVTGTRDSVRGAYLVCRGTRSMRVQWMGEACSKSVVGDACSGKWISTSTPS